MTGGQPRRRLPLLCVCCCGVVILAVLLSGAAATKFTASDHGTCAAELDVLVVFSGEHPPSAALCQVGVPQAVPCHAAIQSWRPAPHLLLTIGNGNGPNLSWELHGGVMQGGQLGSRRLVQLCTGRCRAAGCPSCSGQAHRRPGRRADCPDYQVGCGRPAEQVCGGSALHVVNNVMVSRVVLAACSRQ